MPGGEKVQKQHDSGSLGIQVCATLTNLLDMVVLELYHAALEEVSVDAAAFEECIALILYGDCGQRETAPFSDVDLMLLHAPGTDRENLPVGRRRTRFTSGPTPPAAPCETHCYAAFHVKLRTITFRRVPAEATS